MGAPGLRIWSIYYGDVNVGTIGLRSGNPVSTDPWCWRCGFYPGSNPGECTSGTAATFERAGKRFDGHDPAGSHLHCVDTLTPLSGWRPNEVQ